MDLNGDRGALIECMFANGTRLAVCNTCMRLQQNSFEVCLLCGCVCVCQRLIPREAQDMRTHSQNLGVVKEGVTPRIFPEPRSLPTCVFRSYACVCIRECECLFYVAECCLCVDMGLGEVCLGEVCLGEVCFVCV